MKIRDKLGWIVEYRKNHPIERIIRYLIWGNIWQTWKGRKE